MLQEVAAAEGDIIFSSMSCTPLSGRALPKARWTPPTC